MHDNAPQSGGSEAQIPYLRQFLDIWYNIEFAGPFEYELIGENGIKRHIYMSIPLPPKGTD